MIAKGTTHHSGPHLATYLLSKRGNERVKLHELRGFAEENLVAAFSTVHIMADATRCQNPFYHCQVRTPDGENLTREQWEQVADRIEDRLGLTDQPRAIVFHLKEGHEHMHVAWSRIDEDDLTAKELRFDHRKLIGVCRELEEEMGLTRVSSTRDFGEPSPPSRDEMEESRRLGIDVKLVRKQIRQCWERSDGGHAFAAALEEQDLMLARGDRRDFVVVDPAGGLHALGKRLTGHSAADVRESLKDLIRDDLPNVDEARERLEIQIFERAAPSLDMVPSDPEPDFGPYPEQFQAAPHDREKEIRRSDREGANVAVRGVVGIATVALDSMASAAEKTIEGIADMFGGASPAPRRHGQATSQGNTAMKPGDEPREAEAQKVRSASREVASHDPATREAFANNPAAATPDLTQQILEQWRKQREKNLERDR